MLSIIIVTWNSDNCIKNCIQSIIDSRIKYDYEIIIVDNNSKNDIEEILMDYKNTIRIIKLNTNVGFAAANNIGIKEANNDYILLLNPDTIIINKAIENTLTILKSNQEIGIIGCQLRNEDLSIQGSLFPFPTPFEEIKIALGLYHNMNNLYKRKDVFFYKGFLTGAFLLTRKKILKEVNYLTEDYYMYAEDVDLCYKVYLKGYKIAYNPKDYIIHLGNQSGKIAYSKNRMERVYTSLIKFQQKYFKYTYIFVYYIRNFGFIIRYLLIKNKKDEYRNLIIINRKSLKNVYKNFLKF